MSDLQQFYEEGYTQEDPARAELLGRWRALGAEGKAAHVEMLLRRAGLRPSALVEIGCGDGALLSALHARGVASRYDGFELSAPAAEIAAGRGIPGRVEVFDGARVPAGDAEYDLAVVSHVLEHVPDPAALLREAGRVAPRVVAEVPLEANRSARRPEKRAQAREIGHIQAFSRADMHALAAECGLRVVDELTDPLPRRHHAFFASSARERGTASLKWGVRWAAWRAAPRRAEAWFTVHHAMLLERGLVA